MNIWYLIKGCLPLWNLPVLLGGKPQTIMASKVHSLDMNNLNEWLWVCMLQQLHFSNSVWSRDHPCFLNYEAPKVLPVWTCVLLIIHKLLDICTPFMYLQQVDAYRILHQPYNSWPPLTQSVHWSPNTQIHINWKLYFYIPCHRGCDDQ